ncbi:hypothetical protein MZA43_06295 [Haemophilus influenzae]|nr:hypothetical protein [Haemophilus influenzae]
MERNMERNMNVTLERKFALPINRFLWIIERLFAPKNLRKKDKFCW